MNRSEEIKKLLDSNAYGVARFISQVCGENNDLDDEEIEEIQARLMECGSLEEIVSTMENMGYAAEITEGLVDEAIDDLVGPEIQVRDVLVKMDPAKYQDIRESYYKAAEGLSSLRRQLRGIPGLEGELEIIKKAFAAFDEGVLGSIL